MTHIGIAIELLVRGLVAALLIIVSFGLVILLDSIDFDEFLEVKR